MAMKAGLELLTKDNARAGATVIFRGEERIIDEVAEGAKAGVWLKPATELEGRDFIYFGEAARFNVLLVPDPPPAEGGAEAGKVVRHDVVQIRPDASSDFRGCFAVVTGEDESRPEEYVVLEIVLPAQGVGVPRVLRGHVFERRDLRRVGPAPFLPGADEFPREGAPTRDLTWVVNVPD